MSPKKAKTPSQSSGTMKTQVKVSSTRSPSKTSSKSSNTTRKGHSRSTSTVNSLEKNLKKLTTTTPKAKAKTGTSTTKLTKRHKEQEIKVMNSRKLDMFPWVETFPYFMKDETENKKCWFTCEEHATKYIRRYNCKYKLYLYTGTKG